MEQSIKQNLKFRVLTLPLYVVISFLILLNSCADIDLEGLNSFNKEITSFSFLAEDNNGKLSFDMIGTIDSDIINITVPYGTDLNLVPTVTYIGKSLYPNSGTEQTFTEGIEELYTVFGEDDSEKNYTVIVTIAPGYAKDITAFVLLQSNNPALPTDIAGVISGTDIDITVPPGTDTSSLVPTVSITGVSLNPGNNVAQNFPDGTGVIYTVTASDDSTQDYTVTVYEPPLPGNSGTLSFSGITSDSLTVQWTKGTDGQTPQADLEYLVYYSTSSNIDTVAAIEANGIPFGTVTADIDTKVITGLNDSTPYYFNVIITDQNNTKAAYTMQSVTTLDNTPPVPGNTGLITFSGATPFTIDLSWTKGTDNFSAQGNLEYLVYYSTSNNISTVAGAEANGTPFGVYSVDIDTITVTGLNDSTTYYFNVLLRDEADNKAAYASDTYTMPDAIPPAQVIVTSVTEDDTQISIDWTDPPDADFDHIEITWTPGGTGTTIVSAGTETFTGTSLVNDTIYTFSIVSVDDVGNASAPVTVMVTPNTNGPFTNYCIYTADDLNAVRGGITTGWDKTKSYIVMADIDLSSYSPWTPLGTSSDEFSGNFNGNGHDITNLFISTTSNYQGLFGYISGDSIIKNVRIINCDITGGAYVGGLTGYFIKDSDIAGIYDCYVSGSISTNISSGAVYIAGLVGWLATNSGTSSSVLRCGTNVTIIMPSDSTLYIFIGGLVGREESGWEIKQCYSTGNIINTNASAYVGGFAGSSNGDIEDCYSKMDVIGYVYIGAFIGGFTGSVESSYTTGDVTEGTGSSYFGGFSGGEDRTAPDSYYCGTLNGAISDNSVGIRRTDLEMKIQATFTGWDFTTIWDIDPLINDGFPYLRNNMPE